MFKRIFVLSLFALVGVAIAQETIPPDTTPMPPWAGSALVVVIVNTVLGILQQVVGKIPGMFGSIIKWLVDVISANTAHKPSA